MDNFKSTRMFIKMWQPQSNPHSNISYYCNELLTQFSLQTLNRLRTYCIVAYTNSNHRIHKRRGWWNITNSHTILPLSVHLPITHNSIPLITECTINTREGFISGRIPNK